MLENPSATIGRIDTLQALRGVAATLVAAFHLEAAGRVGSYDGAFSLFRHGEAGVDIFFVLSGFIIYYTTRLKPEIGARRFVSLRFWRILPPYWAILSLYLVLGLLMWVVLGDASRVPDGRKLAVSVFLLPFPDHVIIIAWTLSLEILFYMFFTLSYFTGGPRAFFAAMIVWTIAAQVFKRAIGGDMMLSLALHSSVTEFLYGALIAHVALNRRLPAPGAAMIAGTGLMIAYFAGAFDPWRDALGRELMPGLPAALMIWGAVGVKWRMPAGVILWGEASYILYLVHLLVFTVIGQGLSRVAGIDPYSSTPAMLGMLAAATALSCAASVWIEQPYQRWYRARMRQAPGAA